MTIKTGDTVRFTEKARTSGASRREHTVLAIVSSVGVKLDTGVWHITALELVRPKIDPLEQTFDHIGTLALSQYDHDEGYSATEGPEVVSCSTCGAVVLSSMQTQHLH